MTTAKGADCAPPSALAAQSRWFLQRCPEWLPEHFEPYVKDPKRTLLLKHRDGLQLSEALARTYSNNREHDPSKLAAAREVATQVDPIPVGILYRNPEVPCYEDLRRSDKLRTAEFIRAGLEGEFDKFTIWPCTQS